MVKMPSFDELKKLGSGLIDQAKAIKFGEMVDKVKAGVDSMSSKKPTVPVGDEALAEVFKGVFSTLNELVQAQALQVVAVKKMETQLEVLAKIVETYQKPISPEEPKSP